MHYDLSEQASPEDFVNLVLASLFAEGGCQCSITFWERARREHLIDVTSSELAIYLPCGRAMEVGRKGTRNEKGLNRSCQANEPSIFYMNMGKLKGERTGPVSSSLGLVTEQHALVREACLRPAQREAVEPLKAAAPEAVADDRHARGVCP
jgi:hypothetical protein